VTSKNKIKVGGNLALKNKERCAQNSCLLHEVRHRSLYKPVDPEKQEIVYGTENKLFKTI
jgi:hypothetical protein